MASHRLDSILEEGISTRFVQDNVSLVVLLNPSAVLDDYFGSALHHDADFLLAGVGVGDAVRDSHFHGVGGEGEFGFEDVVALLFDDLVEHGGADIIEPVEHAFFDGAALYLVSEGEIVNVHVRI